jgi:hypothetical protein
MTQSSVCPQFREGATGGTAQEVPLITIIRDGEKWILDVQGSRLVVIYPMGFKIQRLGKRNIVTDEDTDIPNNGKYYAAIKISKTSKKGYRVMRTGPEVRVNAPDNFQVGQAKPWGSVLR